MLEISGPSLTPESVLLASGHVERFNDFLVRDPTTEICHRADKLIEAHIEELLEKPETENKEDLNRLYARIGGMKAQELHDTI
jgi:glycyl-tRNA synthetase